MARALPYRARAPPAIAALIEEAPYSRLFVLADPGPTSFVLRYAVLCCAALCLRPPVNFCLSIWMSVTMIWCHYA